jgi:hypothetical protein
MLEEPDERQTRQAVYQHCAIGGPANYAISLRLSHLLSAPCPGPGLGAKGAPAPSVPVIADWARQPGGLEPLPSQGLPAGRREPPAGALARGKERACSAKTRGFFKGYSATETALDLIRPVMALPFGWKEESRPCPTSRRALPGRRWPRVLRPAPQLKYPRVSLRRPNRGFSTECANRFVHSTTALARRRRTSIGSGGSSFTTASGIHRRWAATR